MRETVTIFVPNGYKNADEFLRDCQFERAEPPINIIAWDAPSNRSYPPVEARAAEIYAAFDYDGPGEKPAWLQGGNSLKQDLARMDARQELRAAGHKP